MNKRPSNVLKALRKVLKHREKLEKVTHQGQVLLFDSYKNAQCIVELVGTQDAEPVIERLMHHETGAYHILRQEGSERRYIAPDPLNALHLMNDPFGEVLQSSAIVYEKQAFLPYPLWMDWSGVAIFGPIIAKPMVNKYTRVVKWLYLNGADDFSAITRGDTRLEDICGQLYYPLNRLVQYGTVFHHHYLNEAYWIITAHESEARDEAELVVQASDAPLLRAGKSQARGKFNWSDVREVRQWLPEQARAALIDVLQLNDIIRATCSCEEGEYADQVWSPPLTGMDAAPRFRAEGLGHDDEWDDKDDDDAPLLGF
jgi:hypothetical protein